MTTFQAIIYSIIHGLTEFLPVGVTAHHILLPYLLGWPAPSGAFDAALSLGAFLALFVYFRHDWASIISSFLQVLIYRKRPMTIDERLPLFMAVASVPMVIVWYLLQGIDTPLFSDPLWIAGSMSVFGLFLWYADSRSRKSKGMFDLNWLDSLAIGVGDLLMFVPGAGRTLGALSSSMLRNYNREIAAKFTFYMAAPLLAAITWVRMREVNFHLAAPMLNMTWLSFGLAVVVTFLSSLLAIAGLMKHLAQRRNFKGYILYRYLVTGLVFLVAWLRYKGYLSA